MYKLHNFATSKALCIDSDECNLAISSELLKYCSSEVEVLSISSLRSVALFIETLAWWARKSSLFKNNTSFNATEGIPRL